MQERFLATLIDQHINVTEHDYLTHERLHVDLRNFMMCRMWLAKADRPAKSSMSNAPQVQCPHRAPGGHVSSDLATSIASFMNAWLSFLKPVAFPKNFAVIGKRLLKFFVMNYSPRPRALASSPWATRLSPSASTNAATVPRERWRWLVRHRRRRRQLHGEPMERILLVVQHASTVVSLPLTRKALIVPRSGRFPRLAPFVQTPPVFVTGVRREDLQLCFSPHALRLVIKHQRSRNVWRKWPLQMIDVGLTTRRSTRLNVHVYDTGCARTLSCWC